MLPTHRPARGHARPFVSRTALALLVATAGCDALDSSTDPTPETGGITITTTSSGPSLDQDGYTLTVDGSQTQSIAANGTASFTGLPAGPHSVELGEVADNCATGSPNPQTVTVAAGGTASLSFQVSCVLVLSGKILFHSERDGTDGTAIYMMNTDGSDQVELVDGAGNELNPAVSPDGTKVAYNLDEDIYVASADGSGAVNLTQHPALERRPSWSPDGTKIAFFSDRDVSRGGAIEIFVMDADGSNTVRVGGAQRDQYLPAWSPDGTKIAFLRGGWFNGEAEIYVMDADGSNHVNLSNSPDIGESVSYTHLRATRLQ